MAKQPLPSFTEEPETALARDIDAWVERELESESNEPVPDFWDEYSTSERLACYLTSIGWQKR